MNSISIIGNLTVEPVQKEANGSKVTEFRVAVNRRFKKNGVPVTDFYKVSAWRHLSDPCMNFLAKGRKVYVRGELQPRLYEDGDGKTRLSLDVAADEVEFLTSKSETVHEEKPITPADLKDIVAEDIPF